MQKWMKYFTNQDNSRKEQALLKKIYELLVFIGISCILMLGAGISYLFEKNELVKNLLSLSFVAFLLFLMIALRYAYYYYTGNFETIVSECLDVSYTPIKKAVRKECEVFVKADDGNMYRFFHPYKKMLFQKQNKLKIYVSDINPQYVKDGYIQLNNIILIEAQNLQSAKEETN